MTKDELEAIRARVDGATRGPWEAVTPKRYAAVRSDAEGCYVYTQGKIPADTHPDTVARQQRDAQFIASARQDVPALLAEVDGMRESCTGLVKQNERQYDEVLRLTAERDTAMDRMQQAVIDLLNEHNAPLHLIARVVEMEYP